MKLIIRRLAISMCVAAPVAVAIAISNYATSPNAGRGPADAWELIQHAAAYVLFFVVMSSPFLLSLLYIYDRVGSGFRHVCAAGCIIYLCGGAISAYAALNGGYIGEFKRLSVWLLPASLLVGIYLLLHERR